MKALRIEKGWSQSELAARLSVSRQTVNAIENERYDPSLPLAFAIARVLERRIEDIFEE
ncbi:transcriptional regulator [Rhizobium wenxiniae]|uniref:Putative transcriptional regulator n=1 Tax=Rhizobium wenxiniae TaxID=1737357 RepID=A0A7W9Y8U3_9HYPH|nr:helix-turn-helix transcriptional regulator [Rhizobium wenxiniae]MBB6163293.1 putative transcriptional regulator [Rhizobium wenxiniae]GGF92017.1 transcriptional regulator [Rhizobium wenxiniae]